MPRLIAALLWIAALAASEAGAVTAGPARLQGIGIDELLAGEPLLPPETASLARELPIWVRLLARRHDLDGPDDFDRLDARLALYAERGLSILLALIDPPDSASESEPWREGLRALASRCRGRVKAYEIGAGSFRSPGENAYLLKVAAIQIRSGDPDALVVQAAPEGEALAWQESLYREEIAPYVDGLALPEPSPALRALVEYFDPTARLLVTGVALPAGSVLLATHLRHLSEKVPLTTWRGEQSAIAEAISTAARFKDLFSGDIVTLDEGASRLRLSGPPALSHQIFYNLGNFSTYLALSGEPGAVEIEIAVPTGTTPLPRSPSGAGREALHDFHRDEKEGVSRLSLTLGPELLLLEFGYGADFLASRTDVVAAVLPTVEEIVFRHQQAQAAQDGLLQNYMARARIEVHFRPGVAEAGFDVVTDNNFYYDRQGIEWEELAFSVNGARWGPDRPAFPLLQPEKVLSLPLDLRLTRDYVYRLEGVERVGGRDCYVVRFEPVSEGRSLFRGTAWIDQESFLRNKVQAVQTGLSPPVVSNDETQIFASVAEPGGRRLFLLNRLDTKQLFLIAGRNLLVERTVHLSGFRVNSPDFVERRVEARRSNHIMLRDTDQGLRYFVKRGGERVVSEELTRSAKALAMGVLVDPSLDFPLPIFGINYLDFDFLGKDLQLALVFGGVLALGNVQHPKALGGPLDVSVDFFGIAVPVNDQVFGPEGEIREERLHSIPFSTGVNLGYQFTSFQKATFSYQFRYDVFFADDRTAADFAPPVDTLTNLLGAAYEYRRGGYSLAAGATYGRRGSWEKWGRAETPFDPGERNYVKYNAGLSKDFYFRVFHKLHLDGAYFGGERLDRFSMYQFGLFSETRVHGVPSAGIRFAELALVRGSYSFNLLDQYRLDLFLDAGWGRNPFAATIGRGWERLTGVGVGVNLRGPWKTLLRLDAGKSFLPRIYSGSGSTVVQLMLLKPL